MCSDKSKGGVGIKSFSKMNKALICKWIGGLPTIEMLFGERLFAANLVNMSKAGTPVTSEVAMGLAYGRKSEKSGSALSRTQSLPLGTVGGSTSGMTFGVVRSR